MQSTGESTVDVLGESLTLPLQQAVSLLSSLELRLHYTQRLPGRKHRLSVLSTFVSTLGDKSPEAWEPYSCSGHLDSFDLAAQEK